MVRAVRAFALAASGALAAGLDLGAVRVRPVTQGRVAPNVPYVSLDSLLDSKRGTVIFAVRRPG
eukprot:scaffold57191_cov34-Tisochrysis_lutea.AAC.1